MKTVLLEGNNAYCFLLLCFPGEDEDCFVRMEQCLLFSLALFSR